MSEQDWRIRGVRLTVAHTYILRSFLIEYADRDTLTEAAHLAGIHPDDIPAFLQSVSLALEGDRVVEVVERERCRCDQQEFCMDHAQCGYHGCYYQGAWPTPATLSEPEF